MDFLGIGPLELIVVLIIALIVVGPERLPQVAQSIGKTLRDLRAMSQGLTDEWQREITSVAQIDTGEGLQQALIRPFKEAESEFQAALSAPVSSPSDARAKTAPPEEPPSPEQPNTPNGGDHADT